MPDKFVDPVVAEVHATRAAMLAAVGGDVSELMRQVADHQLSSGHRIIREPLRKRTEQTNAAERGFDRLPVAGSTISAD